MDATPLHSFLSRTRYDDLPPEVRRMAERCLLDLSGTAAAGLATPLSTMIRNHAVRAFGAGEGAPRARLLLDGRTASPLGAAMAGGMTIDSFDAHGVWGPTSPARGTGGCSVIMKVTNGKWGRIAPDHGFLC